MRTDRTALDDHARLRASRKGEGGLDVFYGRHRDAILAFHARRVREPELAADLTAETFASALLAIHVHSRDLPEAPLVSLFTIADPKLVDSYRRGQTEDAARRRLALGPLVLDGHNIGCAEAKRVLRQLKRNRRAGTVPMVCGRSRVVQGWRLKNVERAVNFLVNSYRRGSVSFHYLRVQSQSILRPFCPPPRPHSEGV